ncbi:AfsR/SARP family transcriptional regulator [Amycolatopsis speibonae]|uniref:BTAD domain-containing putative transcriptional regulator n=1 Tax=Amycolatopsis speibonae TaxID=1450224 RepID=A0ABV7P4B4_9PSEU
MQICLLGGVTVVAGPYAHRVTQPKLATLLAVLALSPGTPRSSDQLMDEMWPNSAIRDTRNALQVTVNRLRELIRSLAGCPGDEVIGTVGGGYLLAINREQVDAHVFVDLAGRAPNLLRDDPAAAAALLRSALGLWRGPALLDVRDGMRCCMEATVLEERRLVACEDLVTARMALGDERGLVAELRRLVEEHPERERLSAQLMLALYREGRQTEALETYHRLSDRLTTESGLKPGDVIREVYEAILSHDKMGLPGSCCQGSHRPSESASPGRSTGR